MGTHIGLNAQLLSGPGSYRGAGVSNYVRNMLAALPRAAPEMGYTAWVPRGQGGFPGMREVRTGFSPEQALVRIAWEQGALPFLARKAGVDLVHGMAFSVPIASPVPTVVTVFDMSFALFPQYHSRGRRLYLWWVTRLSARVSRAVVAISESTKKDVCRLLGVGSDKVRVIPCGVEECFRPLPEDERGRFREDKCIGRYVYYQGTLEPRKNVGCLIEAFCRLREGGQVHHKLVLGGAPGWGYESLYSQVDRLGLSGDVVFLGYVPPGEAARWYASADVFVYPSAYEGFGLPPLEAMACGTAVIASESSSLPEMVGDAGLLVPPGDAEALARAISCLLDDAELRHRLGERGLVRARRFSWMEAARATAELYRHCLRPL